jgi:chorismate mutase/catechol 2,3-dioxygenase-like lactoylglutathione lyase family enzyme
MQHTTPEPGRADQQHPLDGLRSEIDEIDEQVLALLRRRLRVCETIAAAKRDNGIPMMQEDRIAEVRARFTSVAGGSGLSADFALRLYDVILAEACRVENAIIAPDAPVPPGSRVRAIDHVAVAVSDLEAAVTRLVDAYGFEVIERRSVDGDHSGMVSATLRAGGATIVVCQGTSPESNVSQYIANRGQGVQHIAFEVEDQPSFLQDLGAAGADLLTGIIHAPGLDQSFTRREPATGLQFEFVTRTANTGFEDNNVRELFEAMERENVW